MDLRIYDILSIKMGLLSESNPDLSDKAIFLMAKERFDEAVSKGLVVADYKMGTFSLTPKGKGEFQEFWYGSKGGLVAERLAQVGSLPSGTEYRT
jgi:hypothetical protein